jgi:SAM-dependent methyltransferase
MSSSHFDTIATVYDASLPAHVVEHYLSKRARFVAAQCRPGTGLDVGCGTGVLAQRLAGLGFEMTGIDPSEGMLEIMRARTDLVTGVQGSGTDLPFATSSFDLVLTVAVMHHIADPHDVRAAIAEMVRVVKPGGTIVIWDHNPRNPYWARLMARVPQDDGSERLISEAELRTGVSVAGGFVRQCVQLGLVPDFTPPALLRAAAGAERLAERAPVLRRFCAHNVMLAGK